MYTVYFQLSSFFFFFWFLYFQKKKKAHIFTHTLYINDAFLFFFLAVSFKPTDVNKKNRESERENNGKKWEKIE